MERLLQEQILCYKETIVDSLKPQMVEISAVHAFIPPWLTVLSH